LVVSTIGSVVILGFVAVATDADRFKELVGRVPVPSVGCGSDRSS